MSRLILLLFASLVIAFPANAGFFVIDSFNNPNPEQAYSASFGGPVTTIPSALTPMGASRTGSIAVAAGLGANDVSGSIGFRNSVSDGLFEFDTTTFARASSTLTYTGSRANFFQGGLPLDLYITFRALDPGNSVSPPTPATTMPLDVAISTTSGPLSGSYFATGSPTLFAFRIPVNTLTGSGDLFNITSLSITFNGGPNQRQSTDLQVTDVSIVTSPVPPTFLVALAGCPLLARLRRRK